MNNEALKQLCFVLIRTDSEEEIIKLSTKAGFWNNDAAWRYYGDYEGNYAARDIVAMLAALKQR